MKLSKLDIVTLDFETYYNNTYTLKKMTTEEYIRNPLFEIICVGVKVNNNPVDVYSGKSAETFLRSLDYSKCAVLCHNTAFDGAILSWRLGIKPKFFFDTLSMARALHGAEVGGSLSALATYYSLGDKGKAVTFAQKRREELAPHELEALMEYCGNDVELTYKLFKKLVPSFPLKELQVIDLTVKMFTDPKVHLDPNVLTAHLEEVRDTKRTLANTVLQDDHNGSWATMGGFSYEELLNVVHSNDKFAGALVLQGVTPPSKISPKTGKPTYAFSKTDKEFLALLKHPNSKVRTLVEVRLGLKSTIEESRTQALLQIASRGNMLPILLNYYGAHTGRFSGGGGVNLQNLPARTNTGIRRAIVAPTRSSRLIACDSSQIEARMVAWLAGQDDLVQAFREGRDVYSEFASEVYGRKITKADTTERFVGKTCILGLGYGMGAEKFRNTLEIGQNGVSVVIDQNEAERIVRLYRQKNWKIVQLWNLCGQVLTAMSQGGSGTVAKCVSYDKDGIVLPNGLKIRYAGLRNTGNGFEYVSDPRALHKYMKAKMSGETATVTFTKIYGGKVCENIVQALAAIVIRQQMADIGEEYSVAFQVHDEIVLSVGASCADHAEKRLIEVMKTPPDWALDLPLACESGQAYNYGEV